MSLLVLKRYYEFDLPLTASIDLVNLKYSKLLNLFNFVTGHDSDTINFNRKLLMTEDSGFRKTDALSVFREGNVKICKEKNKLKIIWTVKLGIMYYLAFLIDIFLVFFSWYFFSPQILDFVIIAISGFLITCFLGITEIISKINEINATCLN